MARWVQTMNAGTTVAKIQTGGGFSMPSPKWSASSVTGSESAARIEPRDTYFVAASTTANRTAAIATGNGASPASIPAPVATPFPPFHDSKNTRPQTVNTWPSMAAVPASVATQAATNSGREPRTPDWRTASTSASCATSVTATKPLAKSSRNTSRPGPLPSTRIAFVAPALPLPCWRRSTPLIRATTRLQGTAPSR